MKQLETSWTINKSAGYGCLLQHLPSKLEALQQLAESVEFFAVEMAWDAALAMQINLVLEELIINVINYGYPDGRIGCIDMKLESYTEKICIHITDDADAFDPFSVATPDLSLAVENRLIGGLGIHLVRNYIDAYSYKYVNNHNDVMLTKYLPGLPPK